MRHFAVIVAGGRGERMNNPVPKQFMLLDKIPILMRTLHAFNRSALQPEIVVVLAPDLQAQWTDLCYQYQFHVPHYIAEGGRSRFESVRNGLDFIVEHKLMENDLEEVLIAVHDGARPLISTELIESSFHKAAECGAVTLGIPNTDSVRWVDPTNSGDTKALQREQIYRIQTPQTFRASLLLKAYRQTEQADFTDDASVVEKIGIPVAVMDGDPQNIKITHRRDLLAADAWLRDA